MKRIAWLGLLGLGVALAAEGDGRGWTSGGTIAAGTQNVLGDPTLERPDIDLPKDFAKSLHRPSLLVYFSPTCPHCRHVADELRELSKRLEGVDLVMVATGSATDGDLAEFRTTYRMTTRFVRDDTREIGAAMGARSTPSALLVVPEKGRTKVEAAWYPYTPGTDRLVEMRLSKDPFSVLRRGGFTGTGVCAACHVQEGESWLLTHHSVAWMTLLSREEHENPECVGCHVTGFGVAGGWDPVENSELVDVGCEACHSAAGPHDGKKVEAATTCAACHDEKHSLAFRADRAVPLIDHYRSVALDEAAWLEERKKLLGGEAPRTLLTTTEGEYAGAEACSGCHEAQHAEWAAGPHGQALAVLSEGERSNVDCVRCHATRAVAGTMPTSLDGFRTGEGVGCEACHGPGAAHVEAKGGTENIERLGDDCPVCVIEAVCTGCHTPQWDPDWDLTRDLAKVGHSSASGTVPGDGLVPGSSPVPGE